MSAGGAGQVLMPSSLFDREGRAQSEEKRLGYFGKIRNFFHVEKDVATPGAQVLGEKGGFRIEVGQCFLNERNELTGTDGRIRSFAGKTT